MGGAPSCGEILMTGQVTPLLCASFPRQHYIDRVFCNAIALYSHHWQASAHAFLHLSFTTTVAPTPLPTPAQTLASGPGRLVDGWSTFHFSASLPGSTQIFTVPLPAPDAYFEILVTRLPSP